MAEKKCWSLVRYKRVKGLPPTRGLHYENKEGSFHAKVSKMKKGYAVEEYVGNRMFPLSKPSWKKFNTKEKAVKEAKRYINKHC